MRLPAKILIVLLLALSLSSARAPLESYKRYMIVLVHGVGANTQQPNDYQVSFGPEYVNGAPRKSSIFDASADDNRGVESSAKDSSWQGNIGGSLQKRGFLGHAVWYDFYEPWRTPVYISGTTDYDTSLSKYLGDRDVDYNPMGKERPIYKFVYDDKSYSTSDSALDECVKDRQYDWSMDCSDDITVDSSSTGYFGETANSHWLHHFFPNDLSSDKKVEYKGHTGPFLELAQEDWKLWDKLRYGKVDESEMPQKYILVGHSMGGLTTRDYITGPFYKGDVDKLITLDSPHEGSEIANYVQYWHENSSDVSYAHNAVSTISEAVKIAFTLIESAGACASAYTYTDPPFWVSALSVMTLLYKPFTLQETSSSIANSLSGYHGNSMVFGDKYVNQGIEIMTLADAERHSPNDKLAQFNNRSDLNDKYGNGYSLPFFSLVSTSGVPTPGGDILANGVHETITQPYDNNFFAIVSAVGSALEGLGSDITHMDEAKLLKFSTRLITALAAQSIWDDDGSGFVPGWSGKGNNVSVFSSRNADTKRYNVDFDYEKSDLDELVLPLMLTLVEVISVYIEYKIIEDDLYKLYPQIECGLNILSLFSVPQILLSILQSGGASDVDSETGKIKTGLYDYVGFHGGMVRRVDEDDAPNYPGSGMKLLDELLWERPSVSFTFDPVNPYAESTGGYVGLSTTEEEVAVMQTSASSMPVKWTGDDGEYHLFEVDLTDAMSDGSNAEEISRKKTLYITGKKTGTTLKSVYYRTINDDGTENDGKKISLDACLINGGEYSNGAWTVSKENEGSVQCELDLAEKSSSKVEVGLEAYHEDGNGALLVNVGREPGKVFVEGGNSLVKASGTDWDRYITFKNRRYQKKAEPADPDNPTEDELDKTVAEMVDYRRTPLLVVNKLPKVFDLEIDDLQPDRMKKLEILFNFGSSKIVFESVKNPNDFDIVPAGFTDHPDGFIDPSQEKYKVTVKIGEAQEKTAEIMNPVDAWGRMTIDLNEFETVLGMPKGTIQPFLEGRNHLRIFSENRWGMSRVQDMNLFIPGPPPTVQLYYPLAGASFCGSSKLEFYTNLIYNQSSELEESDLDVYYTDSQNAKHEITGFEIEKDAVSNTLYKVTSAKSVEWPSGEVAVTIKVTPRINGTPSNPVNYVFTIMQDCVEPVVAFDEDQETFNPKTVLYSVYDKETEDGEKKMVEDAIIEIKNETDGSVTQLYAENFSAPGAKVYKPAWPQTDGKYILSVRAHDNTIASNAADLERKAFWDTYGESGELPDLTMDFAKYCDRNTDASCPTWWAKAEKEISLDYTAPAISAIEFTPSKDENDVVTFAGPDKENGLLVKIVATDALSTKENPPSAELLMVAYDKLGTELTDVKYYINTANGVRQEDGTFVMSDTIIAPVDQKVSSVVGETQLIPDGLYRLKITASDKAGNTAENDAVTVKIDRTAPRIVNANVPYNPKAGGTHTVTFEVDEDADADALENLDAVSTTVSGNCGNARVTYTLASSEKTSSSLKLTYTGTVPSDASGECMTTITAEDGLGNARKSENAFVVGCLPPEITSPANGDEVSGRIAVYGVADDPSLNEGAGFAWYELCVVPVDADGNETGTCVSTGISVPEANRCSGYTNRSCAPVSRASGSNVLGYWNTALLTDEEKDDSYRIKLTASDGTNAKSAYVDVAVSSETEDVSIAFDENLPSAMDFTNGGEYDIDWNISVPLSNVNSQVRLEISRLNSEDESVLNAVSRVMDNPVPDHYFGEPTGTLNKGAYLWLDKSEADANSDVTRYHLRLVAGSENTVFTVSFRSPDSSFKVLENGTVSATYENTTSGVSSDYSGIYGTLNETVKSGASADYVIESKSKKGLYWNIGTSYLNCENCEAGSMEYLYKTTGSDEYAFVGSEKLGLGSSARQISVKIPATVSGRNFTWNGKTDKTGSNVTSGKYRIKAILEGLEKGQTAEDEAIVQVTGAPVNITEAKVTPEEVDFGPVTNLITLSFKIDQDALVSVYARKTYDEAKGCVENDMNETMSMTLDGSQILLDKQFLAGRNTAYNVNWDGVYDNSSIISPYACGYDFVIQAYDLDGTTLQKEQTVHFDVTSDSMTPDDDNVKLYVDGNSDKYIYDSGIKYQVAEGLNDIVIQASPAGKRIVRDSVDVALDYKGTQIVPVYPVERYSVGVQIHKKSIKYWAVIGAHYRVLYEGKNICNEHTHNVYHAAIREIEFNEDDPDQLREISANFSNSRSSDLNGRMTYVYASLALIPQNKISYANLSALVDQIEPDDYENVLDYSEDMTDDELEKLTEEEKIALIQDDEYEKISDYASYADVWAEIQDLSTINFAWQTNNLYSIPLESDNYTSKNGIQASKRESFEDYKANFASLGWNSDYGMPAVQNTTDLWWNANRCDIGLVNGKTCLSEEVDLEKFCKQSGDQYCNNGIHDNNEPNFTAADETYSEDKHGPEMLAYGYAWKNTRYDPNGCAGCYHCRNHMKINFTLIPQKRFWADPVSSNEALRLADYGWGNDVNRYLTLDPLNKTFLFDEGAPYSGMNPIFISPVTDAVPFNLANTSTDETELKKQTLMTLLHNRTFQATNSTENALIFTGALADDLEMILHYFKVTPNAADYTSTGFKLDVKKDKISIYTPNLNADSRFSEAISLGGMASGTPLTISVWMDVGSPVAGRETLAWPISSVSDIPQSGCVSDVCGENENDRVIDIDAVEIENPGNVTDDGYKRVCKTVQLGLLDKSGANGYDMSVYKRGDGESYSTKQGPDNELILTDSPNVTITDAVITPVDGNKYALDDKDNLYRVGMANGADYDPFADPLMAKIDDDGDGLAGEDGTDGTYGEKDSDDDGDLAVDEDPKNAFRTRVSGVFPFIAGGSEPYTLSYNLSKLVRTKANAQNVVPSESDAAGWSILKSDFSDAPDLRTKWEDNDGSFDRTKLYYKDGKPHTDVEIASGNYLTDFDATKGTITLKPAAFDGRDRRVVEVRGQMPYKSSDKYEIYASSANGWTNLTPENPRTSDSDILEGTLAYWDVETSGFHKLLLVRTAGGSKYYKVFNVAIGSKNESESGTAISDALGRSQLSSEYKIDFVDVVPLGSDEVPQTIPGGTSMGPVVQVYPAVTELENSITVRLRYTRDEVVTNKWTQDASIYVVGAGETPTRLQAVTWAFYDENSNKLENATIASSGWDYAVISGTLTLADVESSAESVDVGVGESETDGGVTVKQVTNDSYMVTVEGE